MFEWTDDKPDPFPLESAAHNWLADALANCFMPTAEELARVYDNALNAFNRECDRMEREETEIKVKQLLGETLGAGTWELKGR